MTVARGWRIEEHAELDSTQDELRRRLESGENVERLVIRAAVQTAGRGQRSRDWQSDDGGSWQTAALKGHALPAASLFMAIGIARQLNSALDPERQLNLKWPNDILLAGRKVAGILAEYSRGHLLVGVGVNVNNRHPATAAPLSPLPLDQVHTLVLEGVAQGWHMMHEESGLLAAEYRKLDSLHGKQLQFSRAGVHHVGTADGVDLSGRLRLDTGKDVMLVDSAVSLRPVQ